MNFMKPLVRELMLDLLKPQQAWREMIKDDKTIRLTASIEQLGQLHEPIVRRGDVFVIAHGRRRVAAAYRLGKKTVSCKLVDCTDAEMVALEAERDLNNDPKSPSAAVMAANYVERVRVTNTQHKTEKRRLGRPPGPGKAARKAFAATLGISEKAVQVRLERARRQERAADPPPPPVFVSINTFGLEVDPAFTAEVAKACEYTATARQYVVLCQGAITRLINSGVPFQRARAMKMRTMASGLCDFIRDQSPSSLCPWCKGLEGVIEMCQACHGTAVIVHEQESGVPMALRDTERPMVAVAGRFVPAEDLNL
jgi:hypothetical protein